MKLVKNEKLENNRHELQFSIDAETFNTAVNEAFKQTRSSRSNITSRASARARPPAT